MKKIYYANSQRFWIDTNDYDYTKINVGDKIICINSNIIYYASMPYFKMITKVISIYENALNCKGYNNIGYYTDKSNNIITKYKGIVKFEQIYNFSDTTIIQTHSDWLQRFILLDDWIKFERENKLLRILTDHIAPTTTRIK